MKKATHVAYLLAMVIIIIVVICIRVYVNPVLIFNADTKPIAIAHSQFDKFYDLADYHILSAEDNASDNTVYIDYEVLPKDQSAYFEWDAGNGTEGHNGWLIEKTACIHYRNIGPIYYTVSMGTGV